MALTLYFLVASFAAELPWATCRDEWNGTCVDSNAKRIPTEGNATGNENFDDKVQSSAELYFT